MNRSYHQVPNLTVTVQDGTRYIYRDFGQETGIPVFLFPHLAATLEQWDPRVVDQLGKHFRMIAFDNKGVGGSTGHVPTSIPQMARDALAFIDALGFEKIKIFAFSLGGMVAQELVLLRPDLVEKIILAGTSGRGGLGLDKIVAVTMRDMLKAGIHGIDPKRFLFFNHDEDGKRAAMDYLLSVNARKDNRDKDIGLVAFLKQLKAIKLWSQQSPADLSQITIPTLIVNGDRDRMVPTPNSHALHKAIPASELVIYPQSGHGGVFQYYEEFSQKAIGFFRASQI